MTEYNAEVEIRVQADSLDPDVLSDLADEIVSALAQFHASVGRGPSGNVQVTMTIPASSLEAATGITWTLLHGLGLHAFSFAVMLTTEFDRRYGLDDSSGA